jgi:hypothetical protein
MQLLPWLLPEPLSFWRPVTVLAAAAVTASPLPLTALRSEKASRRGQIVAAHFGYMSTAFDSTEVGKGLYMPDI